jgi:probable rRNA maturation factor
MSEPGSLVQFDRVPKTIARGPLRSFARRLQREVAGGRPFTCLVTRDDELRRLNRQFLGKDYPTDVLSFPSLDEAGYLGDVAVSVDRAIEQAARFGHSAEAEIEILLLHGVLHLLGMDHERDGGRMRRSESGWRRKLNLPAGLIERARA